MYQWFITINTSNRSGITGWFAGETVAVAETMAIEAAMLAPNESITSINIAQQKPVTGNGT